MAEFQAEIDELSDAISESEAAQELSSAWDTLNAELAASVATMREDGTIAREEIESGLEDFEQQLDDLEVEENVRIAWESLRSHVEALMS
jgi:gas vesicle protein